MNVLVVGSGGREHALAWKMAQSSRVKKVYVAPGNAGTERESKVENVAIQAQNISQLGEFALRHNIELTVVGPEDALAAGIADQFQQLGLAIIGPSRAAARLESSKIFSKDFMVRHNIPTAQYQSFEEGADAIDYLKQCRFPVVVKADGLAAGKGVLITQDYTAAVAATKSMLAGEVFSGAGKKIVIEEFLAGEEASFICLTDGSLVLPLASSQDHKARDDGDKGPNTGGMGAYSPAPVINDTVQATVMDTIIKPCIRGMQAEGTPFVGFLYAGLMIGSDGKPRVLEFNCRLGDPETQAIIVRLQSDLVTLLIQLLEGGLKDATIEWDERVALNVVMAAGGYPGDYTKGHVISGLDNLHADAVKVFHAGTAIADGDVVNTGGRVLCVTALANTLVEARAQAYKNCEKINWEGAFYRRDIGARGHQI